MQWRKWITFPLRILDGKDIIGNMVKQECPYCGKGIINDCCGAFDLKTGKLNQDAIKYRERRKKERNSGR